jgi:hypothetical protein
MKIQATVLEQKSPVPVEGSMGYAKPTPYFTAQITSVMNGAAQVGVGAHNAEMLYSSFKNNWESMWRSRTKVFELGFVCPSTLEDHHKLCLTFGQVRRHGELFTKTE